jgi:hypothetical protein
MNIAAAVRPPVSAQTQAASSLPKSPTNDRDHDGDNDAAPVRSALPASQGKNLDVDA